jgi:hypothetical protein
MMEWTEEEAQPTKYWSGCLTADTSLTALVTTAKERWIIERSRLNWPRFNRLTRKYVPPCRVLHLYPEERFFASRP